jgi:flagellar FliL protein
MATARKAPNAAQPAQAAQTELAPVKSSKKKMLFIILGTVLLLVAGGAGAWYMLGQNAQHDGDPAAADAAPAKPPVFMVLEPFTVNLQMEEGVQQFLQVGMTLQVADQAQSDLIKLYLPQVRSRLLMLLSSKNASAILTIDGKQKLAGEVVAQVKDSFSGKTAKPEVSDVFFTSFVIQ